MSKQPLLAPRASLALPAFEARQPVTQTYTFYRDGATVLYAMSHPVDLDRSAKVHFNALTTEQIAQTASPIWPLDGEPWVEEITYVRSNAAVDSGETYRVVSNVSRATVSQLETAGVDYPAWVVERYLQLPDTITDRTRQLARDLTEPFDNPYDKAQAIEQFLRTELTYNEKLAALPLGVEKVDYILFTAKEAYCDYYASSMIVMLRSLGIPARLAAGFAQGAYNSNVDAFHVVNADAHSWVEVYFPRYGWVDFEPTAAQPTIIRPTGSENDAAFASGAVPRDDLPGLDEQLDRPGNIPIDDENMAGSPFVIGIPWLGAEISLSRAAVRNGTTFGGMALLAALIAAGLWWRRQLARPADSVVTLYRQMTGMAGWMGLAKRPWQTPYEHSARLQRSLPTRRQEVELITGEYVHHTFSPHAAASPADSRTAAQFSAIFESNLAWNRLRPEMLKAAFKRHLPRWMRT